LLVILTKFYLLLFRLMAASLPVDLGTARFAFGTHMLAHPLARCQLSIPISLPRLSSLLMAIALQVPPPIIPCAFGMPTQVFQWSSPLDIPTRLRQLLFLPDISHLVSLSGNCVKELWDGCTSTPVDEPKSFMIRGHAHHVSAIAFSSDGGHLASVAHRGYTIRLWDWHTGLGTSSSDDLASHPTKVHRVACSPDGSRFASVSARDRTIRLWDGLTGAPVGDPLISLYVHDNMKPRVSSLTFSPDNRVLACIFREGPIDLWDGMTGVPISYDSCSEWAEWLSSLLSRRSERIHGDGIVQHGWAESSSGSRLLWIPYGYCGPYARFRDRILVIGTPEGRVLFFHHQ